MTRWERLELYLFDHDKQGTEFTTYEYVKATGLPSLSDGSLDVQGYLAAQRGKESRTLFVLHRVPGTRTSNTRWAVGVKSKDARDIGKALVDDTKRRVHRAFMPDLVRLKVKNPKAARLVEAQLDAVVEHAVHILAVAAEGMQSDEE